MRGGLLAMKEGGSTYYYLYDGKGNVTALTDSSGNVVATYTYNPFGVLTESSGMDQPFRFSTKRYDEDTGLSYYGYRFYSASLGRWMIRDPLGEAGGMNLYGFVGNNSINGVDPLGLIGLDGAGPGFNVLEMAKKYGNNDKGAYNASVQFGGTGAIGHVGISLYGGFAYDTKGNYCLVSDICAVGGTGLGAYGSLGLQVSAGTGELCDGITEYGGVYAASGSGLAKSGMVSYDENGNAALGTGFFGVGYGIAGGVAGCMRSLICF